MKNLTFGGGEGRARGPQFKNSKLNHYIGKHMKMVCFKFQKKRTINIEFYFLRGDGREGGQWDPHL